MVTKSELKAITLRKTSDSRRRNSPAVPSPKTYTALVRDPNVIRRKELILARNFHMKRMKELNKQLRKIT